MPERRPTPHPAVIDPAIVVMMARPNKISKSSKTPEDVLVVINSIERVVTWAMTKKHDTAQSCRSFAKSDRLLPPWPRNRNSRFSWRMGYSSIYVPSSKPTTDMRRKRRRTETSSGTPFHMVSKRATRVTAKQKSRMVSDMRQQNQKKSSCVGVRSASRDSHKV